MPTPVPEQPGVKVTFRLDEDGERVWFWHHCSHKGILDDGRVTGGIPVTPELQHLLPKGKESYWTVVQRDPLTVQPSIQCMSCNLHGFITDGQWVDC